MLRAVLATIGLCVALSAGAGEPTLGSFLYGQATPIATPAEARFARLSFTLERCSALVRTSWYDAAHVLVAADELQAPDGRLSDYRYWRANVAEWVRMRRSGAVLTIDRHAGGQSRSAALPVSEDIMVGPMMVLAAERELSQLEAGRELQLRYAAPEKFAIYDFSVMRVATTADAPREIEIAPAAWLLRRFVHPLDLYFDRDGLLTRVHGRILPVMGTAAREQPLDVEAVILRRETHGCSTHAPAPESYPVSPAVR